MALDLYANYFTPYVEEQLDAEFLVKGLARIVNTTGILTLFKK